MRGREDRKDMQDNVEDEIRIVETGQKYNRYERTEKT